MTQVEVESLTTCNGASLAEARKSLLLQGYEIDREDEDAFTTAFKVIHDDPSDRFFRQLQVERRANRPIRGHLVEERLLGLVPFVAERAGAGGGVDPPGE
jgi:hypothetical protein